MEPQNLPQTDSIRELAQFWDARDLTDFEEVAGTTFDRAITLPLRLESSEAEVVRRLAESRGMADVDLIHPWVLEKIARP